jgi:hypothetical protein
MLEELATEQQQGGTVGEPPQAVAEHGEDELLRERERLEDELLRERERFLPAASLRTAPMDGLSLINVSGEARLASCSPLFFALDLLRSAPDLSNIFCCLSQILRRTPWSPGAKIQITKDVDPDTIGLLHPLLEGFFFLYSNPCPGMCSFP